MSAGTQRVLPPTSRRWFVHSLPVGVLALGWDQRVAPCFPDHLLGANTAIEGYSLWGAIDLIRRLRFRTLELQNLVGQPEGRPGQFPGFDFRNCSATTRRRLLAELASFSRVTVHLPYTGVEYFAPDRSNGAEAALNVIIQALEAAAFVQAKVAVLHAKPAPGLSFQQSRPLLIDRLRRWGDFARQQGFVIAVETGYPPSVAEFVELIKEVDHPAVGATLDVGHQARYVELQQRVKGLAANSPDAIRAYNDVNVELVRALGDKLVHLHVHDIEPSTWREHQPLRYGFVDYPRLLAALRELRYSGSRVLEIAGSPLEMPRYLREAKRKLEGYVATACKG